MNLDRRQMMAAALVTTMLPCAARSRSKFAVMFWFYTSEEVALSKSPVSYPEFKVASLDLPCHGQNIRPGEPGELNGWRFRVDRGEDLFDDFTRQCSQKLDALIQDEAVDGDSVFVGGVSRGAYAALTLSIVDPRFKNAIALAPVVDLMALDEFQGCKKPPPPLVYYADILAQRSLFMSIESRDDRVGTVKTVQLASAIANGQRDADLELIIERGAQHETTDSSMNAAIRWIKDRSKAG